MTKLLSAFALAGIVGLACAGVRAQESGRGIEARPRKLAAEKQRREQAPEKKSTDADNPLQGLTKVGVIVDSTPLDKIGLSEEKLRSEVVSRFRSAGITALGNKDSDTNGQIPVLKISVFFSLCGPRCYSSVILFEFKEKVSPNRHPSSNIEATTWLRWSYGNKAPLEVEAPVEDSPPAYRPNLPRFRSISGHHMRASLPTTSQTLSKNHSVGRAPRAGNHYGRGEGA